MKRFISVFMSLFAIYSSTIMAAEITTLGSHVIELQQKPSSSLTTYTTDLRPSSNDQSFDYSLPVLQQAYYQGIDSIGGTVHLRQGLWAGEPYQPGGNVMPQVMLLNDLIAIGPLTANNDPMAVVLLNYSPGGSGQYLYIAVMAYQHNKLVNIATHYVGDRVRVKGLMIKNHQIIVDVIQAGKNDPACCPGDVARHIWILKQNKLVETPSHQPIVRLTPAILANTEWQLESWRYGDPVSNSSKISLRYINGHFVGMVDCNNYTITVKPLLPPGSIKVLGQHAAVTTRTCSAPLAPHYQKRYLEQLTNVTQFTYFAGKLALTYQVNHHTGVMIFSTLKK
ncbi:META domain-containing protein [Photobacterium aquimaris]|uniref:META domain-containing protein n=1 Tax=Photobacterium aquimaris TaxID=512643 RepID=A0A2T3HTG3_9GAMM|nr:META domain-containing protein [Photobacterium aquimaris]OBU21428.1 hypothetical protein AYY21_16625 [Photobacterium aquimaris]PQJ41465.1 hypothetical protein BTN98_07510 [Photobacterium aquimaris]PST98070.1 META domain-containing protein [Photobacterium aquimaris]